MTYPGLKKWTSLFIAFAFIANSCSPLYAAHPAKKNLGAQVAQRTEQAKRNQGPVYWVNKGAELAEANCDVGAVKCALNLLKEAAQAKDPTKATVCVPASKRDTKNKVCMNATYFAQGAVHAAVANPKNPWLYYDHKQVKTFGSDKTHRVKTDPFPIRESAPAVFELITTWGVYFQSDIKALEKYFKGVALPSTCGDKGKNTCGEEMIALMGLAFVARAPGQGQNSRKAAREAANQILTKKWKSSDGRTVIKGAIVALATLNTQAAWANIDTFLTSTSLPSVGHDALSMLSVQGLTTLGIGMNEAGRAAATRYYNSSNRKFRYLDTLAAQQQGFKYPYNNPAFQFPDNNVFEEIGYLIGRQAASGNKSAQALGKKIMGSATAYAYSKTAKPKPAPAKPRPVTTGGAAPAIPIGTQPQKFAIYRGHWPLVVGIMSGAVQKPGSVSSSRDGIMHLIQHVFARPFWDLNAGTYLRVFNIAISYGNAILGEKKFIHMTNRSKGYLATKQRFTKVANMTQTAEYVDMAITVVAITTFVASLPDLARSLCNGVEWLQKHVKLLAGKSTGNTASASQAVAGAAQTAKAPILGETKTYVKVAPIQATEAKGGEVVTTTLANGFTETTATAPQGSFIVTNPGGEQYIVPRDQFLIKYQPAPDLGAGMYKPVGTPQTFSQLVGGDMEILSVHGEVRQYPQGYFVNPHQQQGVDPVIFHQTYRELMPNGTLRAVPLPKAPAGHVAPGTGVSPQLLKADESFSPLFQRRVYREAN